MLPALFAAAVALGLSGGRLLLALTVPQQPDVTQGGATPGPDAGEGQAAAGVPDRWPALFGPPSDDTPAPAAIRSAAYTLLGLVAQPGEGWALIRSPEGDTLVRPGERLAGGEEVLTITAEGVILAGPQGRILVVFATDDADVAPPVTAGSAGAATPAPALASASASSAPASSVVPAATAPVAMVQTELALDSLSGQDVQTTITRAGGVEQIDLPDGSRAYRVLWTRNGQLFDRIGLEQGDIVLSVNGQPAGEPEAILANLGTLLRERVFALDIRRNGQPMILQLTVTE